MKQEKRQFKDPMEMRLFVDKFFKNKKDAWKYFCNFGRFVGGDFPYQIIVPKINTK